MKKYLKILGIAALTLTMFVSCNSSNNSSISSSDSVISSEDDNSYEEYYKVNENWGNSTTYCQMSGALIDAAVGKELITGQEYLLGYKTYNITCDYTVATSSNEKVFTLVQSTNADGSVIEGSYTLKALHAGNAYITIEDSNGLVRLRQLIYVRDPMTLDEMYDYLPNVETWVSVMGWGDSFGLTFLFDNQVIIEGSISGTSFDSYVATYKLSAETEEEFQFKFTDDNSTTLSLTGFNISKTGDFLYLQDSWGTAAIMLADTSSYFG